jgi:hypothetical protein
MTRQEQRMIEDAYALAIYRAELTMRRRLAGRSRPPRRPVALPATLIAKLDERCDWRRPS